MIYLFSGTTEDPDKHRSAEGKVELAGPKKSDYNVTIPVQEHEEENLDSIEFREGIILRRFPYRSFVLICH